MRSHYLILTAVILFLLVGCNSKPEKSESVNVEIETEEKKESSSTNNTSENSKSKSSKTLEDNFGTYESMLFSDTEWYTKDNEIGVFKGLNDALMSYILIDYIHETHLDPNRHEVEPKDSISIDLLNQSFTYFRFSASSITEYEVKIFHINNSHRLHWEAAENMTEEEKKEWKDEHQEMLDKVDQNLKNSITYDRLIIKGKWNYKDIRNDSLFLKIEALLRNTDPIVFSTYGENSYYGNDKFTDEFNLDLFEMINGLGQYRKFIESDLKIIDPQDLTYVRNQFYARKGFKFKTEKMQNFFGPKQWYEGTADDVTEKLSEIELYNIHFIKDLEDDK